MVSQHPFRFSASVDINYLIFYVILQNRVVEGSCNFMGRSFSFYATSLPNLLATGICHMNLQDHVIKE